MLIGCVHAPGQIACFLWGRESAALLATLSLCPMADQRLREFLLLADRCRARGALLGRDPAASVQTNAWVARHSIGGILRDQGTG